MSFWINYTGRRDEHPLPDGATNRGRLRMNKLATPPVSTGLMYLVPSYKQEPPPPSTISPGLSNIYMQGILWRESWERLERTGPGCDLGWLDTSMAASESHSKIAGMEILAGSFAPDWFFSLPGAVTFDTKAYGRTTVPWDRVFHKEWKRVNKVLASRYDGRIKYIKIIGAGHSSESFLVNQGYPEDQVEADRLSKLAGFSDAVTAWQAGVKRLIDMYAKVWPNTMIMLGTGPPFPVGGDTALQAMMDYGDRVYPGKFNARCDGLYANKPHAGEPAATIIQQISKHGSATGYQFGNHMRDPVRLDQAMTIALSFGARVIEVFADDADDPRSAPVLQKTCEQLGVL